MSKRRRKSKFDRNENHNASISALSHDGRGIARIDGKTTFVFAALPGEEVVMQYRAKYKQYDEADTVKVIKASAKRVTPICESFGICGGCSMQHMGSKDQIEFKQQVFREQLQQYAGGGPEQWLEPLTAATTGYRRKARLSVREVKKKQTVMLGFRERDGRFVTDMRACPILDVRIGDHLSELRDLLGTFVEKAQIPQVEVSMGDTASIIVRHLVELSSDTIAGLKDFCAAKDLALYLQPGNETTVHKVYPDDGQKLMYYTLPEFNLRFAFHPSSFIQVNAEINAKMMQQILDLLQLDGTEKVLDLFCGIGNISLPIARSAKEVVGVEVAKVAVEQAIANAVANSLSNASFYVGDLFSDCTKQEWLQQQYDVLLLDPPRAGAKEILEFLPQINAKKIVYVSCHPMTLARDAAIIMQHGYKFSKAGVMDMFPHTKHVESIAYFYK